jgi:hypothetical protein
MFAKLNRSASDWRSTISAPAIRPRLFEEGPFDKIKIDQSFVRGAAKDGRNAAIIRAIVTLAESLDMTPLPRAPRPTTS